MVNLYKLYFYPLIFLFNQIKEFSIFFTFLPSQQNTYKKKLNLFYSSTFLSSPSIFYVLTFSFFQPKKSLYKRMCNLSLYLIKTTPNYS